MQQKTILGVLGGSGLYDMPGLKNVQEVSIDTPFGSPSDLLIQGEIDGRPIIFLPRHGKGHRFTPTEVNYRANIYALKKLGVTHVLSVSAVGSLKEDFQPGHVVVPNQIIDRTTGARARTYFGNGLVGHVSLAEPYCEQFRSVAYAAAKAEGAQTHFGGTYVCVEGPRFSSKAESHLFRSWGAGIIGMTAMPEASLAREAELAYVTLAFVTDYDCWREGEAAVSVEEVIAVLKKNVALSQRIVKSVLLGLPVQSDNSIFSAAQYALMTAPNLVPAETKRALNLLYGKYWQ